MTRTDRIEFLASGQNQVSEGDVELAVETMLESMSEALASGERIEIRRFGSFILRFRSPRIGRNRNTDESLSLSGRYVPHFKPGKELRERVMSVRKD